MVLPLLTRIDHVGIACRDLDRTVGLYQATFGLEVVSLEVNAEQGVREAMLRVGGAINLLLDGLVADRARSRRLASQVISAQDEERARNASGGGHPRSHCLIGPADARSTVSCRPAQRGG